MDKLFILVLSVMIACKSRDNLDFRDLKFPEFERQFIESNKVDTMYVFVSQESGTVVRYYEVYDENGRVTYDSTWGNSVRNYYDSSGLLVKRETRSGTDSARYEFDFDRMLLKQKWSSGGVETLFYYDNGGRIYRKSELEKDSNGHLRQTKTDYEYQGDLVTKCTIYFPNSEKIDIESKLYYSPSGKIDSAVLRSRNHRQGWIYDSQGLLMAQTSNGNRSDVRFVYSRRR